MASKSNGRGPPKWVKALYRIMATGRHASSWLPELIVLYEMIESEEGEEKAQGWLTEELARSIRPSLAFKLSYIFHAAYKAWKMWKAANS